MSQPPRITIAGTGAVSAAGWGMPALLAAMEAGQPLPLQDLTNNSGTSWPVRRVPKPDGRPAFLAHPRLRRSSPISQFAAAAALEALGPDPDKTRRTGVIFTLLNGCVHYSGRFFGEVLHEPSTASPILFPETVFNAPASHLATLLGFDAPAFTLIGDSAQFISGVELALQWLLDGVVDACLVVGAEEVDPLTAEALRLLAPGAVLTEGAAALYLEIDGKGPHISEIAGPIPIVGTPGRAPRTAAAHALRKSLAAFPPGTLLIDDATGCHRSDAPGLAAWQDFSGPRQSPRRWLGEAPGASTALQCVLAVEAILNRGFPAACVSAIGADQQASALVLRVQSSNPEGVFHE
jgi:Beta-ketoacyl synthase, N-terminal domain